MLIHAIKGKNRRRAAPFQKGTTTSLAHKQTCVVRLVEIEGVLSGREGSAHRIEAVSTMSRYYYLRRAQFLLGSTTKTMRRRGPV
jgi:hypothetical protein